MLTRLPRARPAIKAGSLPVSPHFSQAGRIAVECTRCSKWRLVNEGEGAEDDALTQTLTLTLTRPYPWPWPRP